MGGSVEPEPQTVVEISHDQSQNDQHDSSSSPLWILYYKEQYQSGFLRKVPIVLQKTFPLIFFSSNLLSCVLAE